MKTILLALRGGADQPRLIGPAAQIARETGAQLTVLAVDDADLIVVGSSPAAGVVSRLLGSFPLDLVQKADRQVMVVTDPGGA